MSVRRVVGVVAASALLVSCSEDAPYAPRGGPGISTLSLHVLAPPAMSRSGTNLAVEQIRATLIKFLPNESQDTVASRTVPFSATSNAVSLSFSLLVSAAAETLSVYLDFQTATGRTLFTGSQQVVVRPGVPTAPPPLVPFYVGPGGNVAAITLSPRNATATVGGLVTFTLTAIDSQQAPVLPDSLYVSWSASAGVIDALGNFRAPATPGPILVKAQTPNGTKDSVFVTVVGAGAGTFAGQVLDASTGAGLANVTVTVLDSQNATVTTVTTAADGTFSTGALPPGVYSVVATINSYVTTTLFSAVLVGAGTTTLPTIPLAPTSASLGGITGVVKDATNALPIIGASVVLRAGVNATSGTTLDATTTDSTGTYSFIQQPVGTYSVTAIDSAYLPATRTSVILGGATSTGQDVVMAPVGSGSEIRVVLTWGATPADLDLHATGPDTTSGTRFHVYYSNLGSVTTAPYDSLEFDVTSGFGPETNLLAKQYPGIYRFYVFDYTDGAGGDTTSALMAASGARVDLYRPGVPVQSFFVPNQPGTLWTVFELNGATVTPINTVTKTSDYVNLNSISPWTGPAGDVNKILTDIRNHPKR